MHPSEAAELRAAGRRYRTASGIVDALVEVDAHIPAGALTVVAGPSGSGKSTLLGLVMCTDRPDAGAVIVGGVDVGTLSRRGRRRFRRTSIGIVLPQPADNLLPRLTAADNIRWAASLGRRPSPDVDALLAQLDLTGSGDKLPAQLSGGEQQRVAIATAIAAMPSLIAADEPTSSLDGASAARVGAALRAAVDGGATVVVASHDPHLITIADHLVRLEHGRLVT